MCGGKENIDWLGPWKLSISTGASKIVTLNERNFNPLRSVYPEFLKFHPMLWKCIKNVIQNKKKAAMNQKSGNFNVYLIKIDKGILCDSHKMFFFDTVIWANSVEWRIEEEVCLPYETHWKGIHNIINKHESIKNILKYYRSRLFSSIFCYRKCLFFICCSLFSAQDLFLGSASRNDECAKDKENILPWPWTYPRLHALLASSTGRISFSNWRSMKAVLTKHAIIVETDPTLAMEIYAI